MDVIKFLNRNINPTPLSMIKALSFHRIATINHPKMPTIDKNKSYICNSGIPLMDIAESTNALDTHFRYQDMSYFGVAFLYSVSHLLTYYLSA